MMAPKKETRVEEPKPAPEATGPTVTLYGYAQTPGLAGHFAVYKLEVPVADARLKPVAERLPKRAAFEKLLFLARQELFRAVVTYKRPPPGPGAA